MAENHARTHYYHADANALGGVIQSPFEKIIPVQAPLSLPSVGGYASARVEQYRLEEIVSIRSGHTQVSGAPSKKPQKSGAATTLASAVIEGLNVRDVLTADRVVGQISTEHPTHGGPPTVSFTGTTIENLRISGKRVELVFDLDLCAQDEKTPATSCIKNPKFLEKVGQKYDENRPHIVCSLVREVGGKPGNLIDVPDFGKIYLAELIVDHYSYKLTMIRLELGCAVQASMSMASPVVNGGGTGG